MIKMKPTLRYYARFVGASGYLRAVVRYKGCRKYITTPLVISLETLQRLDTSGHITPLTSPIDIDLNRNLEEYTTYVWNAVTPLIKDGTFEQTASADISKAIIATKELAGKEVPNE